MERKDTKKAKKWTHVKVEVGDYAKAKKAARVRGISIPQYVSLLINK